MESSDISEQNSKESYIQSREVHEKHSKDMFIELISNVNDILEKCGYDFVLTGDKTYPHSSYQYLDNLNTKQKLLLLEVLLINYWKDKDAWYYDPNIPSSYGSARFLAFDLLPVTKITPKTQSFLIDNLEEFINRATYSYTEEKDDFSYFIDFPNGDIELIKYLIPCINIKLLSEDSTNKLILINKKLETTYIPAPIKYPIKWLEYEVNGIELLTNNYDSWAKLANEKFIQSTNDDQQEIKSLLVCSKKLSFGKNYPDDKWIKKSEEVMNTPINYHLIYEYLQLALVEYKESEWYWYDKNECFKPSFSVNAENINILKPLIWLFCYCEDKELLVKLCELIPNFSEKKYAGKSDSESGEQYVISLKLARTIAWAVLKSNLESKHELMKKIRKETSNTTMLSYLSDVNKVLSKTKPIVPVKTI